MLVVERINTFYGLSHILFDVSLEVHPSEIVCVLGRNGVGKTTLLRSIMSLTPPKLGTIKFRNEEIVGCPTYKLAQKGMGFVPAGRRIFPDLTVRQNLEIATKPSSSGSQYWSLEDVFALFPVLKKMENRFGTQLSGGEQQMLAIARALIGNPDLLLMDEPTEGLSPLVVSEVKNKLESLKGKGVSILICEQNIRFAFSISSRGYILDKGRVHHQGPVDELKEDEEVKSCLAV